MGGDAAGGVVTAIARVAGAHGSPLGGGAAGTSRASTTGAVGAAVGAVTVVTGAVATGACFDSRPSKKKITASITANAAAAATTTVLLTCTCQAYPIVDIVGATMKIANAPFSTIDWTAIAPTIHAGTTGTATWRTYELGNVRVRFVDYSPGYIADHWCERGHVLHVLAGEIHTELRDGRVFQLSAGSTYVVAEGIDAHRSSSPAGAHLYIVD